MVMGGPAVYEGPTLREAHDRGRELTHEQVKKLREHFHTAIQDLSVPGGSLRWALWSAWVPAVAIPNCGGSWFSGCFDTGWYWRFW